ncbi:hypothetical protein ANO11243_022560 [Dothideomycetidae sp. 11243]|nr:hypothetical protein ANO11243_022560 [fungal sp. No.11243]
MQKRQKKHNQVAGWVGMAESTGGSAFCIFVKSSVRRFTRRSQTAPPVALTDRLQTVDDENVSTSRSNVPSTYLLRLEAPSSGRTSDDIGHTDGLNRMTTRDLGA